MIDFKQMALYKVLEDWGIEGFLKHAETTAELYKTKRDQCLAIMEKHLKGTILQMYTF